MSDVIDEVAMSEPITEVGVDAGAVEAADASGVAEAAIQESVPESATPAWAPSQEAFESLQNSVAQIGQLLTPVQQAPQAPQYLQEDPTTGEYGIDPNALTEYINFQIQQGVDARLSPVEPILSQTVADRGEQVIAQHLDSLEAEVGSFDKGIAREIAEGLAARPGADPYQSLKEGARRAAALEKQIADRAIEQYKVNLGNVANAPTGGGAAGGSAVPAYELPRDNKGRVSYESATDNWLERNGYIK